MLTVTVTGGSLAHSVLCRCKSPYLITSAPLAGLLLQKQAFACDLVRLALLGRHGSPWVAAGDAGRGKGTGKMYINTVSCPRAAASGHM